MINSKDHCVNCLEPISNPICRDCYLNEIEVWMDDNQLSDSKKRYFIKKIREKTNIKTNICNSKCILCKKNQINFCSYCIFLISVKILIKMNLSSKIIENFLEVFNYQLEKSDYDSYILNK
jgi:hypothetical protein